MLRGYALAEIRKDFVGVVVKRHKKVYQFKRPLMGLMEAKQAGTPAKTHPPRNYWAYLTNKRQNNVVPLQRNFKTTAPARVRPDLSGLKLHPPVIIGNTLPTNGKKM